MGNNPQSTQEKSDANAKKSEVEKWLLMNGVEDTIVKKIKDAGYEFKKDLTKEVLKNYSCSENLKEPCIRPGLLAKLQRLLDEDKKWEQDKKPESLDFPKLEGGTTLNLSNPKFESNKLDFDLKALLKVQVDTKQLRLPTSIVDDVDWIVIARNSKILYGRRLDTDNLDYAHKPLFHWMVPTTMDFFQNKCDEASVKSEVTYSERDANHVSGGLTKGSLSIAAGYGPVSGGVSVAGSREENSGGASTSKDLYIVGIWDFPRVKLFLNDCTKISESFSKEVKDAIAKPYPENKKELQKIFQEYGHVYSTEVELGGRLYFIHHKLEDKLKTESQEKETIKAAVSAKLGSYAKAQASVEHDSAKSASNEAQQISENISFNSIGGNTLSTSDPTTWVSSLGDPILWAVINLNNAQPTLNLLDKDIREQVKTILRSTNFQGIPYGYESEDRSLNIVYSDSNGDICELNKTKSLFYWSLINITELAELKNILKDISIEGTIFGYGFKGSKYVIFRSSDDKIHEIKIDAKDKKPTCQHWNLSDKFYDSAHPGIGLAGGNPYGFGLSEAGVRFVIYRGKFGNIGNIGNIYLAQLNDKNEGYLSDLQQQMILHNLSSNPAIGDPHCYSIENKVYVAYRDKQGHIYEINIPYMPNEKYSLVDLMSEAITDKGKLPAIPPSDSDPYGYSFSSGASRQLVYYTKDGHIHCLSRARGSPKWKYSDLTSEAKGVVDNSKNAPKSAGMPSGYAFEDDQSQHIVYRDHKGRIYELLCLDGASWKWRSLSDIARAPDAADDPKGFAWNAGGSQHVTYSGEDDNIHELFSYDGDRWFHNNLSE